MVPLGSTLTAVRRVGFNGDRSGRTGCAYGAAAGDCRRHPLSGTSAMRGHHDTVRHGVRHRTAQQVRCGRRGCRERHRCRSRGRNDQAQRDQSCGERACSRCMAHAARLHDADRGSCSRSRMARESEFVQSTARRVGSDRPQRPVRRRRGEPDPRTSALPATVLAPRSARTSARADIGDPRQAGRRRWCCRC